MTAPAAVAARYSDRCPSCPHRTVVPPLLVLTNTRGTGVVADYVCPAGHAWFTGWGWWDGRPHPTDGVIR